MNTLKYKGYIGSVNYSEPDKVFFGKLEGIDDLVNYEGESVKEITDAFHEAVDDYLIFCEDQGVKPEKSYTGTFNVRIAPATHRDIANLAAEENISINAFVKKALAEAVANYTPEQKIIPKRYPTPYERHLATLNEPEETYGTTTTLEVTIPSKEISFAKEIFKRFGWDFSPIIKSV
ncbi:MAG: type II toxin-antitoxin system HicB family antitoxin [Bacteroidales bacterium]|nr:type II toxin-antitoxin system HicB family antitoxin [Bacteroidales bacterium]